MQEDGGGLAKTLGEGPPENFRSCVFCDFCNKSLHALNIIFLSSHSGPMPAFRILFIGVDQQFHSLEHHHRVIDRPESKTKAGNAAMRSR